MELFKSSKLKLLKDKYAVQFLLFIITLIVYTHNLSPSVYGGDSGDFIAAALTRGVPHPSGYPLYTMVAIILLKLPLAVTPAWKVGLASSFFASLTVVVMYMLLRELKVGRLLSSITSLTLAFTYTFWLYAEVAEVFSLHSLFIIILIYFTVKLINTKNLRYFYYLSFFIGLSLTNNLSILLIFPGIFITTLVVFKKELFKPIVVVKSLFLLLLGLSPYVYIPIAAKAGPAINWGNAVNFDNFIALVFRKDYGWVNLKFETLSLLVTLKTYLVYWKLYVNILIPILAILGAIKLTIIRKYTLLVLLMLNFLLMGPFMVLYSRGEIQTVGEVGLRERFYLPSVAISFILVPFGITLLREILLKRITIMKNFLGKLILIIFLILPISALLTNYQRTNFKNVKIGDNLGIDILNSASKNSTVLLSTDSFAFNSLYLQHAYDYRTDVYIPGTHEGYKKFLAVSGMSEEEIENYDLENRNRISKEVKFSSIGPMEGNIFTERPFEIHDEDYGKIISIPYGLVFKYVLDESNQPSKEKYLTEISEIWESYNLDEFSKQKTQISESLILSEIQKRYSLAAYSTAQYIISAYDDKEAAKEYFTLGMKLDPVPI
jgi:hypothetical protein